MKLLFKKTISLLVILNIASSLSFAGPNDSEVQAVLDPSQPVLLTEPELFAKIEERQSMEVLNDKRTKIKVTQAIQRYLDVFDGAKTETEPEVVEFFKSYFTLIALNKRNYHRPNTEEIKSRLDVFLSQIDHLLINQEGRNLMAMALASGMHDVLNEQEAETLMDLLQKNETRIDAHYIQQAKKEVDEIAKDDPTLKIDPLVILRSMGSFTIYGLCVRMAIILLSGGHFEAELFTWTSYIAAGGIGLGAGFFKPLDQLYQYSWDKITQKLRKSKARTAVQRREFESKKILRRPLLRP